MSERWPLQAAWTFCLLELVATGTLVAMSLILPHVAHTTKNTNRDTLLALSRRHAVDIKAVPHTSLTMGMGTMREAKEVMVIFTGVVKAHALESCLEKPVNHMFPVSVIQRHNCAIFVCDEDATEELRMKTVRYFKGLQETAELTAVRRKLERLFRFLLYAAFVIDLIAV